MKTRGDKHASPQKPASRKRKRPLQKSSEKKAAPPQPKKKKRRKIKEEDRSYHPRGKSRQGKSNANPLHLRIKVTNNHEKIIALYYLEAVEGINEEEAAKHIRDAITVIRDGKPLDVRVKERSESGTPTKVMTPGGSLYYGIKNYGSALFFSTIPHTTLSQAQTTLTDDNKLHQSVSYQSVKESHVAQKQQTLHVTKKHLAKVQRERAKAGRRTTSQNQVMKQPKKKVANASANLYAQATDAFPQEQQWEWLHMIAHSILGALSQHEGNLVCGSFHANTDMIFTESQINEFSKAYPDGFDLEVIAHMVKGTQICHQIEYIFHTKDFTLPFIFNAQTNTPPRLEQEKYVQAFTSGILQAANVTTETREPVEEDKNNQSLETPKREKSIFLKKNPRAKRTLQFDSPEEPSLSGHLTRKRGK